MFENGRLIRFESLNPGDPKETCAFWRGKSGEPLLVRRTSAVDKSGMEKLEKFLTSARSVAPSAAAQERVLAELHQGYRALYNFGIYDDRLALSRVIQMDSNLSILRISAFEVLGNYEFVKMHDCDAQGRVVSSIDFAVLDAKGQKVDASEPSKAVYSFHHEEVMAPTRAGLEPYYPPPMDAASSVNGGPRQ